MTVAKLAREAGVTPETVRYYTRIGLLHPRRRGKNRYNYYAQDDVARLVFIRKAQNLGFSLADVREILLEVSQTRSPCPRVREILQDRLRDTRRRIKELTEMQTRMEKALRRWRRQPDGMPDGEAVCHLIESEKIGH